MLVRQHFSNTVPIPSGVPRGVFSVSFSLSCMLVTIQYNYLYADNTKLIATILINKLTSLRSGYQKIINSRSDKGKLLVINNVAIDTFSVPHQIVLFVRDHGVIISKDFKWNYHISYFCPKIRSVFLLPTPKHSL